MTREFQRMVGGRVGGPAYRNCGKEQSMVSLAILDEPPAGMEGVLGLAYASGENILPRLVVFFGPLYRHAGSPRASEAVGRSIARVAAHELEHFLGQRRSHCRHGLFKASLSAYELTAADRPRWRLGSACRPHLSR